MNETISATQIDEDAELADAGDLAALDLALSQLGQEALLLLGPPLLHGRSLRENDSVATAVDLDDLDAKGLAHPRGQTLLARLVGGASKAGARQLGERYESMNAFHVHQEAALVEAGHFTFEGCALLVVLLEETPALLAAGPIERDDDLALEGFRLKDGDENLVPGLKGCGTLGA